jgi:hypothetical protein
MYLLKVISKNTFIFVGILKVTDEKSRIRKSVVRIRGSGFVPKCHGSGTLCSSPISILHNRKWTAKCNKKHILVLALP